MPMLDRCLVPRPRHERVPEAKAEAGTSSTAAPFPPPQQAHEALQVAPVADSIRLPFPVTVSSPLSISRLHLPPPLQLQLRVRAPPGPRVRIYAYDLPTRFNRGWVAADERCARHLFAAEVAVHEALLRRQRRALLRPEEADLFLVPVYVSCNFSTPTGLPSLAHARGMLAEAVALVRAELPYWNRSGGADHVFVASHDFGACFHPREDVAIADGIPEFLKRSILLQTFGVQGRHACQKVEHVVIPPHVPPEVARELPEPEKAQRDIFAFFRGKMELHPKNMSGRFYSKKVRTELLQLYARNRKFYLKWKRYDGSRKEMARSLFCLCPLGWAPWSPRLVESVLLGCIPVIIADNIRLPFPGVLRWPDISLQMAERDMANLEAVLDHVVVTNLTTIQKNLWDPVKRRALVFNHLMEEGDATWQILKELEVTVSRLKHHGRTGLRGKS